jgi:hypothetical protein
LFTGTFLTSYQPVVSVGDSTVQRLLDINATFHGPRDRHDDRQRFFDSLSILGEAERASETQYYVLTSDEFENALRWIAAHIADGDFLKVQDVTTGEFAMIGEAPEVDVLMVLAEAAGAIALANTTDDLRQRIRRVYRVREAREAMRKAQRSSEYYTRVPGALG